MNSRKDRARVEIVKTLAVDCLHPYISQVTKKRSRGAIHVKYDSIWYMKREFKIDAPVKEVIAQELLRLLLPWQQKTRLMVGQNNHGYRRFYVISKEILGFVPLYKKTDEEWRQSILDGKLTGFGEVLVGALFIGEDDLNRGNIGVDEAGRVVKIDGGLSFKFGKPLGAEDIAVLPKLHGDYPTSWIGISQWNWERLCSEQHNDAALGSLEITHSPLFRREVNRALLKIMLLPLEMLDKFISSYEPDKATQESIMLFLLVRQGELEQAAMENDSFKKYLCSQYAVNDLRDYFAYLSTFKTTGKHFIMEGQAYQDEMIARYTGLRETIMNTMYTSTQHGLFAQKSEMNQGRALEAEYKRPYVKGV